MVYKVKVRWPIEAIKAQLEQKAKDVGFGILGSYNFKNMLKQKGFEIDKEITVYELCNPAGASSALNAFADISVYLPCRISIYEEDGVTVLATIGIEDMLKAVDADAEFKKHMSEIFKNLRILMNSW